MNFSSLVPKPKSKMMQNTTNLKLKAHQIRSKNNSLVLLEDHSVLKTPEILNKNQIKGRNTAKVNKQNKLEMKMSPYVNQKYAINHQDINLSDILKTTEYDHSEYPNLLDDINISSELVSLSVNEGEVYRPKYANSREDESTTTPNFPNRVQSKLQNIRNDNLDDSKENSLFDGKYLNMSLGDIPEEHEENITTSENCLSSYDRMLSYNSNTSSKINHESDFENSIHQVKQKPKKRNKDSGDSRFSTYMHSDNLNNQYASGEHSNNGSTQSPGILQAKKFLYQNTSASNNSKHKKESKAERFDTFNKDNFDNSENLSLISNSGNKDSSNYVSNRSLVKPRNIFG